MTDPESHKPRTFHNTWIDSKLFGLIDVKKPSPVLLNQIADRLSRPIPTPAVPPVRTKQSWRTLKLNTMLQTKERWFSPTLDLPAGTKLLVTKVDTEGISLTHHSEQGILSTLRWTNPEWRRMFSKVRRRKKPK